MAARTPVVVEAVVALFALSFVFAALHFATSGSPVTGACWAVVAVAAAAYLVARRVRRGVDTCGASRETFERPSAQNGFLVVGVAMAVVAVASASIALFQEEALVETSWWMSMIASLMAVKWSALAHTQIKALNEDGMTSEPLMQA